MENVSLISPLNVIQPRITSPPSINEKQVSNASETDLISPSSMVGRESTMSPQSATRRMPSINGTAPVLNQSSPSSVHFFNDYASLNNVPPFLHTIYQTSRAELAIYDQLIQKKVSAMGSKLNGVDVVVGIPFYTEITNIISVLVTLKEVFKQRKQRALLCVIGEFSRSDMVESIPLHQLQDDETDGESYVHIETFWKSHPKYASKPFTVRACQVVANSANSGQGAHLCIMDADIQFNHWELSAMSLMRALLDPLLALPGKDDTPEQTINQSEPPTYFHPQFPLTDLVRPPAASFVLLNAPRSFIADDALIHLFTYLMTYAYTGQHIHQSHGGEFSIHKSLNRAFLLDETLVYRGCYCVEAQMVVRALQEPAPQPQQYGGYALEMLMKGKWHAKITLNKLLQMDDKHAARIDLVSEKVFNDALLFAGIDGFTAVEPMHLRTGGLTKTLNPDPNNQSMKVLCPTATKKEMMAMIKAYYIVLLNHQSDGSLPIDSIIVQEFIPLLHSQIAKVPGEKGWNTIVSRKPSVEQSPLIVFGAEEWARYTMEALKVYSNIPVGRTDPEKVKETKQRFACMSANRLIWLVGALAFLNDHGDGLWGQMHQKMHDTYAPAFRLRYLIDIVGIDPQQAADLVQSEEGRAQQ